jgi:hypothetical protein
MNSKFLKIREKLKKDTRITLLLLETITGQKLTPSHTKEYFDAAIDRWVDQKSSHLNKKIEAIKSQNVSELDVDSFLNNLNLGED